MRVLLLLAVLALPFSACPDTIVLGPVNVIDMSTGEVGAGRAVIVEDGSADRYAAARKLVKRRDQSAFSPPLPMRKALFGWMAGKAG